MRSKAPVWDGSDGLGWKRTEGMFDPASNIQQLQERQGVTHGSETPEPEADQRPEGGLMWAVPTRASLKIRSLQEEIQAREDYEGSVPEGPAAGNGRKAGAMRTVVPAALVAKPAAAAHGGLGPGRGPRLLGASESERERDRNEAAQRNSERQQQQKGFFW